MSITARRTPYRERAAQTYVCARCGITRGRHGTRPVPDVCRDCRDVLALIEREG